MFLQPPRLTTHHTAGQQNRSAYLLLTPHPIMALRRASAAMNRGAASLLARPSRPPSHTQLDVFDLLVDHGANPAVLCTKGRTAGAGVAHFVVGHSLQETAVVTRLLPKVRGTTADTTVDDVLAEIVADGTLGFNVRPFRENLARLVEKDALLRAPAAAAAAASVAEDQAVSWSSVRAELDKHDAAFLRRVWRRLKPGAGAALAAAREDASQRTPLLPHHAARLLLPPLQEVSRRGGSCVGASISRSTSLSCGGMIGGQQRRALSRSVALLAEEGPITMSGGRGNWRKKVEKAEKTCAGKEEEYAVAQVKLEEYAAANPSDTTSDRYKKLEEATATAKGANEVAQGELAVARAGKTCAEKEEECEVAHTMEKYAAANPGYATFDQYEKLKEATATAKAASEVAQGELAMARAGKTCAEKEKDYAAAQLKLEAYAAANPGDTTSAEYNVLEKEKVTALTRVKVAHTIQAVLQAEKELGKAEKRRAEKEKEYAIARNKRVEYMTANPSDTTSAVYNELEKREVAARDAYEELTCAEKEKESAAAQKKLKAYAAANPSDTTSDRYVGLQERADAAYEAAQTQVKVVHANQALLQAEKEREKAAKTCAEEKKKYAVAQAKLEEYAAANPSDTTSNRYKKLEEREVTARDAYEELTCAEKEKESAAAQKKLKAYAAANPSDTTSARYVGLQERADAAYEAAQTQVKVVHANQALLQAEKEREKAAKTCAEKEQKYAVAQVKLEEYAAANPSDTTSDRYKKLEEREVTARVAYEELTCAEEEKDYTVVQKKLEAYAAANPGDTTSAEYNVLKKKGVTARVAYEAALTRVKVADRDRAVLWAKQELEKDKKSRAEKEKEYAVARKKLEEYAAANPGDTTSDRYNELEEWKVAARANYKAAQTWVGQANANLTATLEKTRVATQEVCRVTHV